MTVAAKRAVAIIGHTVFACVTLFCVGVTLLVLRKLLLPASEFYDGMAYGLWGASLVDIAMTAFKFIRRDWVNA